MIRPTTIPHTVQDLILEQAVCREALRHAFLHHKKLATGLKGVQRRRQIGDLFKQAESESLLDMLSLDLIIGSGGVLSHAPDRRSAAFMLIDSYEPEGVTRLAVDSIFMMPHLGVLSTVHPEAAQEIFFRDCLVELGTVIAPRGSITEKSLKEGASRALLLTVQLHSGEVFTLSSGEITLIPLPPGARVQAEISPAQKTLDVGGGPGVTVQCTLFGGHAGIILDGRGRPLHVAPESTERVKSWYQAFELDPSCEHENSHDNG
jgi:hypothetical protein